MSPQKAKELFYFTIPAPNLEQSKTFYASVFGWQVQGGGSLGGHVDNTKTPCGLAPDVNDTTHTTVYFTTLELESTIQLVQNHGGKVLRREDFATVGPCAFCQDDQGTKFALQQPTEQLRDHALHPTKGCQQGDLFFFSLPVSDEIRAKTFFGAVLGWEFGDKGTQGGLGVQNLQGADGGLGCGRKGHYPSFWFRVVDIADAVASVKASGGKAGDIFEAPEGRMSECYDDQGVKFGLVQPAPGY